MYQNIYIERNKDESNIIVHLWDDNENYKQIPYSKFDYVYSPDPTNKSPIKSLFGHSVRKIYNYQKYDTTIMEKDIPMETRVLSDLYLHDDLPSHSHRILFFDIEVSMLEGIPSPTKAENVIYSISAWDNISKKYQVFVFNKNNHDITHRPDNVVYHIFDTEHAMLQAFLKYYTDLSPTIISGWNSDYFDVPYLYNRLNAILDYQAGASLSPIGIVKYNRTRERYTIAGVSSLDYMALYRKFTYNEIPNYRLGTVGLIEVKEAKVDYEGTLDELFQNDLNKFLEYNIQDVRILTALNDKLKLIELVQGICHVGHVPYEDYSYSSRFLEGTLICYLHRKNIVVPNKPEGGKEKLEQMDEENEDGFAGAYVMPPKPGLYNWVYSLDLQSLYPSIIMSLNISPETKVGQVINWNLSNYILNSLSANNLPSPYKIHLQGRQYDIASIVDFKSFMEQHKLMISSNGILYTKEKGGVIPEVLTKWFAERVEYKNLMKQYEKDGNKEQSEFYNRRQHIQKILLNSLYGVLGLPIFRFYDLDNALAVTATGQDIIKSSAKYISSKYSSLNVPPRSEKFLAEYKIVLDADDKLSESEKVDLLNPNSHCIYIDTDSVYFSVESLLSPNMTEEEKVKYVIDFAISMEKQLNAFYNQIASRMFFCDTHKLYIKGESICKTALWIVKKRYALLKVYDLETNTAKEKLTIKGLDVIRSSFPKAFQEFMKEILMDILKNTDKSVIDKKIIDFKGQLKNKNPEDIAKNTSVKNLSKWIDKSTTSLLEFMLKTPAHVKAALVHNRLLKIWNLHTKFAPIEDGEKIKWVYCKTNEFGIDVIAFRGFGDAPKIKQFVKKYIDYNTIFEKELKNKLSDFYDALGWGILATEINQNASKFFDFE